MLARDAHLRNVDLNLLRTIQPLLEERHVSRAAKRSFLSQPAMSRALTRLRERFGDPLLVRANGAYERTPRGERVLREIETIMRRLNTVVSDQKFTPAESRECFRVAMTDHGSTILLPSCSSDCVETRLTPNDLSLCAEEVPPTVENEIVFNLDFVCQGAPTNQQPATYLERIFTIAARDDPDR
jgi:DNA-binding transcriptional LysR family regulator